MRSRPATPCRPAPRRAQRGLALVELALVMLPLLLVLAATADLGRAFYTFNTLAQAARGAARSLALADPPDDAAQTAARNLVVYGSSENTGTPLEADLDPAENIEICTATLCNASHSDQLLTSGGTVDLVSVRIHGYAYTSLFSVLLPAKLPFSDIRVTMRGRDVP
jgi:Flp pilus assembly protein TadG